MKIVVLTGSPHREGTSALLTRRFIQGAEETGHLVYRFDAAFSQVHPCIGCDHCQAGRVSCVFQDDMARLYPYLKEADCVAFITPLYYHGASAQIKAVIDRFHGIDGDPLSRPRKAVLLVTAADSEEQVMRGVAATYEQTVRYLRWWDCGRILALGCGTRAEIERTEYPRQAYELGRGLLG